MMIIENALVLYVTPFEFVEKDNFNSALLLYSV